MRKVFFIFWILCLTTFSVAAQEKEIARVYIEEEFSSYFEASTAYLEWLREAANPNVGDPEELIWHLRWIMMITPEESTVHRSAHSLITREGTDEDAEAIVTWWHRQDPLPATYHNERIDEPFVSYLPC